MMPWGYADAMGFRRRVAASFSFFAPYYKQMFSVREEGARWM